MSQQERGQHVVSRGNGLVTASYSRPWSIRDAAGNERPALLRVELGVKNRVELDRLIDEWEREQAASAAADVGDVIAWLAQRGIAAEIVPVTPGMF